MHQNRFYHWIGKDYTRKIAGLHRNRKPHHRKPYRSGGLAAVILSIFVMLFSINTAQSDTAITQADGITFAFIADLGSKITCKKLVGGDCRIEGSINGGPATEMQATTLLIQRVNATLAARSLTDWNVVWGPTMQWKKGVLPTAIEEYTPASAMVVFKKGNTYVVAIAGTNPVSDYGWLVEDADIVNFGTWPNGSPAGKITAGTAEGLNLLLTMGGGQSAGTNTDLLDYLRAEAANAAAKGENIEVVVVGHSLGGTLSPVMATTLIDTQKSDMDLVWNFKHVGDINLQLKAWDTSGAATVSTIFFAGATPGDSNFASYANSLMIGTGRLTSLYNHYDVVPRGWDKLGRSFGPASKNIINIYTVNGDYCNKPTSKSNCPFTETTPTSPNPGQVVCPCHVVYDAIKGLQVLAEATFHDATPIGDSTQRLEINQGIAGAATIKICMPDASTTKGDQMVVQAGYQHDCTYPLNYPSTVDLNATLATVRANYAQVPGS